MENQESVDLIITELRNFLDFIKKNFEELSMKLDTTNLLLERTLGEFSQSGSYTVDVRRID